MATKESDLNETLQRAGGEGGAGAMTRRANPATERAATETRFSPEALAELETQAVIKDVERERCHQNAKWGDQSGKHVETWLAILVEEVGEFARAILEKEGIARMRAELVQIAAVAVAAIEALDTRRDGGGVTNANPAKPCRMRV